MKNFIQKIGQNKFQFFFSVGLATLLLVSLVVAKNINNEENTPIDTPIVQDPIETPTPDDTGNVNVKPEEVFQVPFDASMQYSVVRKFYEKNATKEDQELSLIKYNNSYRTSNGTSFAHNDNKIFDVLCSLSGKVLEIKDSPLYGMYVVVEHDNSIKTYYYGLSDVSVSVGATLNQGDKIGVSGTTEIDAEAGVHVFMKVTKNDTCLNPEKLIGKKLSEI
mgnify:CR=1 FL=1